MGGFVRKIIPAPEQPKWMEPKISMPAPPSAAAGNENKNSEEEIEQPLMRKRKGRASTILTTSQGLADNAPIGRKLLLGE